MGISWLSYWLFLELSGLAEYWVRGYINEKPRLETEAVAGRGHQIKKTLLFWLYVIRMVY